MIQVRATTYRRVPGWQIVGTLPGHGWPTRIFFTDEGAARRVADLLRHDPDYRMTLSDFDPIT